MVVFKILFFVCLGVLVYAHVVYPVVIFIWSEVKKKPHQKKECYPSVTLVVPFYKEGKDIVEAKLENVKNLEYPKDKLKALFVSDGAKGRGAEIIEKEEDERIGLVRLFEHQGKPTALNIGAVEAKGEIVVFSDIHGMMNPGAVKYMAENFYDEKVGAVLGVYKVEGDKASQLDRAKGRYWDFELFLKKREGWIWSILGCHGTLYAVRKSLYEPLRRDIINDDFVIPSQVALKGYRTVYEERSVLKDRISTGISHELRRRTRIAYGNWQQMAVLWKDLVKRRGFLLWQFLSHKAVRTVQGFLVAYMVLCSVFVRGVVFDVFLVGFGLVVAGGLLGFLAERVRFLKVFNMCSLFLLGTWGQIKGSFAYFFGKKIRW